MKKLKQGDASRGPEGELVLFFGKQGNSTVECPVFGKEYGEEFGMGGLFFIFHLFFLTFFFFVERRMLVPCDFNSLKDEEQAWVCVQLCEVYASFIKRATMSTKDLLETFSLAHSALQSKDQKCICD
jgi:hypothetical protein